ncbi:hypothetical protein PV328_012290 [Microctonus aethiopoides]|uniref:Uncharacterized protein n=1 Tax=Microctonus aethiopoides TaxID=144406 RepID=A0AA39FGS1_9HYME|nr:hypothetical protein PV328_012290 [Microctonus aethiopoides]
MDVKDIKGIGKSLFRTDEAQLRNRTKFRLGSATLLANTGANLTTLKQHGGLRSSSVVEGCIENSLYNKTKIFNHIVNSENTLFTIQNHSVDRTTNTSNQDELRPSTSTSSQPTEPLATTKPSCKENIAPKNKHESHQSLPNYEDELRAVNDIVRDENFENVKSNYEFSPVPSLNSNSQDSNHSRKLSSRDKTSLNF